jgi:hypothetical protein
MASKIGCYDSDLFPLARPRARAHERERKRTRAKCGYFQALWWLKALNPSTLSSIANTAHHTIFVRPPWFPGVILILGPQDYSSLVPFGHVYVHEHVHLHM